MKRTDYYLAYNRQGEISEWDSEILFSLSGLFPHTQVIATSRKDIAIKAQKAAQKKEFREVFIRSEIPSF